MDYYWLPNSNLLITANRHLESFNLGPYTCTNSASLSVLLAFLLRHYTPYIMLHETDKEAEIVYVYGPRLKRL